MRGKCFKECLSGFINRSKTGNGDCGWERDPKDRARKKEYYDEMWEYLRKIGIGTIESFLKLF